MFINASMTQHLAEQRIAELHRVTQRSRLEAATRRPILRTTRQLLTRQSR